MPTEKLMNIKLRQLVLILIIALAGSAIIALINHQSVSAPTMFDGQSAYLHVEMQQSFGPRILGSEAHTRTIEYIAQKLEASGWQVEIQEATYQQVAIRNVIATRDNRSPRFIIGAHFDSRLYADRDPKPENQAKPVPGANDGASGVAVLLELARVLPKSYSDAALVFFDAEDQGGINNMDWILGSRAFVSQLTYTPEAAVIVDMIGDRDQQLFYEANSDQVLSKQIWLIAEELGYSERFIPQIKYSILDDHTPFLQAGIKAVDIIDFDYPSWHTTEDTSDKVSPESLEAVGRVLVQWLISHE